MRNKQSLRFSSFDELRTAGLNFKEQVYKIVRSVPKGKVTTYGEIARLIQKSKIKNQKYNSKNEISLRFAPRLVGFVLHQNKDYSTPCHRVVDRTGRLAPNFAFDGAVEQKRRLVDEGVIFVDENHVDLRISLWD